MLVVSSGGLWTRKGYAQSFEGVQEHLPVWHLYHSGTFNDFLPEGL